MRRRRAVLALCLVGAVACGEGAIAVTMMGDSASGSTATNSGLVITGAAWSDEFSARHLDDNSDDTSPVSLAGLEVEVELPEELVTPLRHHLGPAATTA